MKTDALKTPVAYFSDAIKWQTFLRVSVILVVLVGSIFILDKSVNEKQFKIHRSNIQAQYAFQLERLVESSADKMIQISGAASLNDGLVKAVKSKQDFLIEEELESLDWHLQADAGLSIIGLFDNESEAVYNKAKSIAHTQSLAEVIQNESPVWSVDCSQVCQILSYTPLLVEGELMSVIVLSEPLSHVLLRFHHVANIDMGLLSQIEPSQDSQSVLENWQRYLEAVTTPEQSRSILTQASQLYSLEELQKGPRVIDLNNQIFELKALPFNSSQLVVMSEASTDYGLLEQARTESLKLAAIILLIAEMLLFAFLWTPLSRLKFSENLVGLLAEKRFEEIKRELKSARPEQKNLARRALKLGDQFIAMQKQIADQGIRLDSEDEVLIDKYADLSFIMDEFSSPILLLNSQCQISAVNRFLKKQLCLPLANLMGCDISDFLTADHGLQKRLEDLTGGLISEYEYSATCYDAQGHSYTYWWRFTILLSEHNADESAERNILAMGMPMHDANMDGKDSVRQWYLSHDSETALLNSFAFTKELSRCLSELKDSTESPNKSLILLHLPAAILDQTRVGHLHYLKLIENMSFELASNSSVKEQGFLTLARLEKNEFAFLLEDINTQDFNANLENFIQKNVSKLLSDYHSKTFNMAVRQFSQNDNFPLDVLFEARALYKEKYFIS